MLAFVASAALLAFGYYHGLRSDNWQEFLSDLVSSKADSLHNDSITVEQLPSPEPNVKSSKKSSIKLEPSPVNLYEKIDKHVRNCPSSSNNNVKAIADYLLKECKTDYEKARGVYVWLSENISYDDASYNAGVNTPQGYEAVLKNKKAVCAGFSDLYFAIGREMGLEIEKISGYAKGYGYEVGSAFKKSNHAWNMIRIDGEWKLYDATWGEGNGSNVNGNLVSKKEFNDYWFAVDPYETIWNHFPENANWTLVQPTIDLKAYESLPYVRPAYFEIGFNAREVYQKYLNNKTLTFPMCYNLGTHIQVIDAPKYEKLVTDYEYSFEFYIPRAYEAAIIDANNNWTYLERNKGVFKLRYTPKVTGDLQIAIKLKEGKVSFGTFIIYKVQKRQTVS